MAANPQIAQGTLNRLRGSVTIPDFPNLNVTASYLGKDGISLAFEGVTTTYIETMVGAVTSLEPYQMVSLRISLLRTQSLAAQYENQRSSSSLLGDVTVRQDTTAQAPYTLTNCSIENVGELKFNGQDAGYGVIIKGYLQLNNDMWNFG